MEIIRGKITQLGESVLKHEGVIYSYIEIGDRMLKKTKTFVGLNGKLSSNLGRPVTLYLDGSYIVAFTDEQDKTYSSERFSFISTLFAYLLTFFTFLTCFIIIGIPFFIMMVKASMIMTKINRGAALPGAIELPRV